MVKKALISLVILLVLSSCSDKGLKFTGNLTQPVYLKTSSQLAEFLKAENIPAEYALIAGKDGTAAYVYYPSFAEIELLTKDSQWSSRAKGLPEVVNINNISHISLFTRDNSYSIHLIENTVQTDLITPFEAELAQYEFLGKSTKNGFTAKKYKFNNDFNLTSEYDSVLVIFQDGEETWLGTEQNSNLINGINFKDHYFSMNSKPIVTVWEDPPVMDVYKLHKLLVEKDKKPSLFIFIDSFGWSYLQHLQASGDSSWLAELDLLPMRVPFPPRTVSTFWVAGTGQAWQEREKPDEFFADLEISPDRALIIEADRQYYPSPVKHILNTDVNENGKIDDEIYQKALEYISTDLDLLLIHFHSLDDAGHSFGAYSHQRYESFQEIADYCRELSNRWQGAVYLFSDHGMHTENGKGGHYTGSAEDMLGLWGWIK